MELVVNITSQLDTQEVTITQKTWRNNLEMEE